MCDRESMTWRIKHLQCTLGGGTDGCHFCTGVFFTTMNMQPPVTLSLSHTDVHEHMCRPLGACLPLKIRGNLIYKHFPIWDLCTWDILKFCMFVCMWVYGSFFEHSKHEKKRKGLCLTSHVILKGPQKRTADMFHLLALTVFSTVLQPSVHAVVVWYSVSVELILLQISCYRAFVFTVCKNNYNCECLFQG